MKAGSSIDFRYGVEVAILNYNLYVINSPQRNALETEGGSPIPEVLSKLQADYCSTPPVSNNLHATELVGNKRVAVCEPDISQRSPKDAKIAGLNPVIMDTAFGDS